MRARKLALNTIAALLFEITSIICSFILPRLILGNYGSEVNGLVSSITQFLSVIALLEFGVGAVLRSALYKPLAEGDDGQISRIMLSGTRFFRRLANIFLVYIIGLIVLYPIISTSGFSFDYIAVLIAAMSLSSLAQYYFGITNGILLAADQRGYIHYTIQALTLAANTIMSAALIACGASIQIVKLGTSLIFLARPLLLHLYVKRNYHINWKITYDAEPIGQKWNGIAQHAAYVVLDSTDVIVLTAFSTFSNVSIYTVYHLVIYGVKTLFTSMTNGVQSLLGELWAKQESDKLRDFFAPFVWGMHAGVVFVFGCTAVLAVPFVRVYTSGITDANYQVPLFAVLITLAHAMHCLRLPYHLMIMAGGHYRQTQNSHIVSAGMNVVVSIVAVIRWGLIGVAVGTLAAMLYQTVWMAWYDSRELVRWPFRNFLKQFAVDAATFAIAYSLTCRMPLSAVTYRAWVILAIKCALRWLGVILVLNLLFYRRHMRKMMELLLRRKKTNPL